MTPEIYCFWLVPEERALDELQRVITGLATDYGAVAFEPHLTLSVVSTMDLADPEGALKSLIRDAKPLTLNNPKVTIGDLFTQSIYLRFEESSELMKLHALSCEALKIKQPVFYPHLSLIYKNFDAKTKRGIVSTLPPSFDRITFDRFQLVKSSATVTCEADVKAWTMICEQRL